MVYEPLLRPHTSGESRDMDTDVMAEEIVKLFRFPEL